jgi:hypothetical protein
MTQKITVMYKAPPGDSKVTEAFGHTFYDGKPEEIEVDDETASRIETNPCFVTKGGIKAAQEEHKAQEDHKAHEDHPGPKDHRDPEGKPASGHNPKR